MRWRRGRIVEFTGAPGSGKSTLAALCAERLRARGLVVPPREHVRDLYLRHGWVGRLAGAQMREKTVADQRLEYFKEVETPFLLWRFRMRRRAGWQRYRQALAAVAEEDPELGHTLERWVERAVLTRAMLRSQGRRFDLFLWEEGVAHRAVNLFVHPARPLDVNALHVFLRHWALPDALVRVHADPDACVRRMAERGLPERLQGQGAAAVRDFVEECDEVGRAIGAEGRRRGLPVFEIANTAASPEALADEPALAALVDDLARLARARSTAGGSA